MSIVQYETKKGKILRTVARKINDDEFNTPKLCAIIQEMKDNLREQKDGVAIAAPQIGKNLRIFVISKHAKKSFTEDLVFINPSLKKQSKDTKLMEEGCLSVRWTYGKVKRSSKATVIAYAVSGERFEMSGSGLVAQIFQHEIDHLNGILFIDNAKELYDAPPHQ